LPKSRFTITCSKRNQTISGNCLIVCFDWLPVAFNENLVGPDSWKDLKIIPGLFPIGGVSCDLQIETRKALKLQNEEVMYC
jgi:hypothetical protein